MPSLSLSTCNSHADCNGEGKCVQADHNASLLQCDCTIGYIEPHCRNRDPCLLEGDGACQNGSTCKRKSNFEYECKCRIPYGGEFCETYDLCDVDVEECIGDLNKEDPQDPICHPCIPEATCIQISKREYICSCEAGFNHSSCFAFHKPDLFKPFLVGSDLDRNAWNPIIPTIAITSCCLYFLILIIVLLLLRKRKKYRPKLIVCGDFRDFDNSSYYLISVESGRQWNAGTKNNVFCFLCGENGEAGPYPLNDLNLCEVNVLQRCQEDNYLVSHTMDLGRVDKIVIWYDNRPHESAWFCDKITVRNIKTEENWYFYVYSWFHSSKLKRRYEFLAATEEYVQKQGSVKINCDHYCYQFGRHHTYLSPLIYTTPDRITLMFAEWMSYMIILIALYGFLTQSDQDINEHGDYIFSLIVPENGSWAAISCFCIGLICALLLMLFAKIKRIPTLVVWHNKPGMPEINERQEPSKRLAEPFPFVPQFKDKATNTEIDELNYLLPKSDKGPVVRIESNVSQHLFRIPSTDVVETEKWVQDSMENSYGPEDLLDEALVHNYKPSKSQLNIPEAVVDYGLIGGLTDGRQLEPNRFVYTCNSNDSRQLKLRSAIENEILDIYCDMKTTTEEDVDAQTVMGLTPDNTDSPPISELFFKKTLISENNEDSATDALKMAGGDFSRDNTSEHDEKRIKVYCELCEIELDRFWNLMAKICIVIGWLVCLCLIISATIICCIYGGRYGYKRTYHWIISLVICWVENFMLYQLFKNFLLVVIFTILINRKKLLTFEEEKLRERFQVYYVNGLTVFPRKDALKFVQYLPKYWIPAPHVQLDYSNTSSDTSVIKNA